MMGWDHAHLRRLAQSLIEDEFWFIPQYKFSNDKTRATFEDLQYYLVGQKIYRLTVSGLSPQDTRNSFKGGLTTHKFREICKKVLHAPQYWDLLDKVREGILSELVLENNPAEIKEICADRRCWIPLSTVTSKLSEYYTKNPLVQYVLKRMNKLTPLEKAKIAIVGTKILSLYRQGCSDSEILRQLGPNYNQQDLIDITWLIWRRSTSEARFMLKTGLL
jgi:hypothetical protein